MPDPLTVSQVADELGVSRSRVHALISTGRLPAKKLGIQLLVQPRDLAKVRVRKPGRPKKTMRKREPK